MLVRLHFSVQCLKSITTPPIMGKQEKRKEKRKKGRMSKWFRFMSAPHPPSPLKIDWCLLCQTPTHLLNPVKSLQQSPRLMEFHYHLRKALQTVTSVHWAVRISVSGIPPDSGCVTTEWHYIQPDSGCVTTVRWLHYFSLTVVVTT